MIFQIERVVVATGKHYEILLNTQFVHMISPTNDPDLPKTRITYYDPAQREQHIIYTNHSIRLIHTKIRAAKKD